MRTKPRWVTNKDALYTALQLRLFERGDHIAFISGKGWTGKIARPEYSRRVFRGRYKDRSITLERMGDSEENMTYMRDTYGNRKLRRFEDGFTLIGWRKAK